MNTTTHSGNKQLSRGQTALLFAICIAAPALIAWLGSMLSKMTTFAATTRPFALGGRATSLMWIACYAFLGASLFLALIADAHNSAQRMMVKTWSLSLWGILFGLSLIWPFFMYRMQSYLLSFVWLVIIDALAVALITVDFKLRPSSAFAIMPFAAAAVFMTCIALNMALFQ